MTSETTKLAARCLYESSELSMKEVAAEFDVGLRTLARWSADDGGWQKKKGPEITEKAREISARVEASARAMAESGLSPEKQELSDVIGGELAVEYRAELLGRHNRDWQLVRGLVMEAIKLRTHDSRTANERARFAKLLGESFEMIQLAELKSWGMDEEAPPKPAGFVVIDRR